MKYKIDNYIIHAKSPKQAIDVKKVIDSIKAKDGHWTGRKGKTQYNYDVIDVYEGNSGRLYALIKRAHDYAVGCGYNPSRGDWDQGYYDFSSEQEARRYAEQHAKKYWNDSVKDEIQKYISPDRKYFVILDGNWGEIYDTKTQETIWSGRFTEGSPEKLLEAWKKANNIIDSCKDATYQFPELTEKDLDALKKYNLKVKGRAGSDVIVEGSLADLKLYARNYLDYDLHPDYIGDEDIESLSKEEEQAIADYKKAIAETNDPKLLRLFAHILKEEIEHLEELQNEEVVDSCKTKDEKTTLIFNHPDEARQFQFSYGGDIYLENGQWKLDIDTDVYNRIKIKK